MLELSQYLFLPRYNKALRVSPQAGAIFCSVLLHAALITIVQDSPGLRQAPDLQEKAPMVVFLHQETKRQEATTARTAIPDHPRTKPRTLPSEPEPERQVTREKSAAPFSANPERHEPEASFRPEGAPKTNEAGAAIAMSRDPRPEPVLTGKGGKSEPPPSTSRQPGQASRTLAHPLYQDNPPPPYPAEAMHRRQHGLVILEVAVDESGRVQDLQVDTGSGIKSLDRAALISVRQWRFSPGRENGRAIAMRVMVPVRFKLD